MLYPSAFICIDDVSYISRLMLGVNKHLMQVVSLASSVYLNMHMCVCVCVCETTTPTIDVYSYYFLQLCVCVRERERPQKDSLQFTCFQELKEKGYIPVRSKLYIIIITVVPLLSDTGVTK
jgi:hypothetical protein